jgi:hypothetical protein
MLRAEEDEMPRTEIRRKASKHDTSEVRAFITRHIEIQQRAGRSIRDIARDAGFERPNIVSMFKTGAAKVPLARIPHLAAALGAEPAVLFRLAMLQYWPDLHHVVAKLFGDVTSPHERELLGLLRFVTRHTDPKLSDRQKREIEKILEAGP